MKGSTTAPRIICITGTDTDAGKSIVTAGLLRAFTRLDIPAQAIKPVQTGCTEGPDGPEVPDVALYKEAAPTAPCRALRTFTQPCSPHLAAKMDKKELSLTDLLEELKQAAEEFKGITLVEGVGGLFVPLNEQECLIHLFAALRAPLILVAPNRLGAINHTLLSLEALHNRDLLPVTTIFTATGLNGKRSDLDRSMEIDNPRIIRKLTGIRQILTLPHFPAFQRSDPRERMTVWEGLAILLQPLARELNSLERIE